MSRRARGRDPGESAVGDGEILAAVAGCEPAILGTVRFVHAHPELAHAEHECSARLRDTLAGAGFDVEPGAAGLETAFVARLRGSRRGRTVGLVALYDAVPAVRADGSIEPVHSCGHGPIAGGAVGAALALASLRDGLAGEVRVVGCPADEIHAPGTVARGGGKLLTAAAGIWDDVDAALYLHPEFIDTVSLASRWLRRDTATIGGVRSLGAGAPQPVLDAAAAALALARRHAASTLMLERLELDGDVEEGTGLVARATFLLFADDGDGIERLAAEARRALPDARWEAGPVVEGIRPDPGVRAAVAAAFAAAGRSFVPDPPPLPFATDFGNVSRRAPAALIGVGREGGWAFHTDEGAAEFASADGEACAVVIARVLALAAARLTEPA